MFTEDDMQRIVIYLLILLLLPAGAVYSQSGEGPGLIDANSSCDDGAVAKLLINAALEGDYAAVKFLLGQGVRVDERNARGYSPLHAAAYTGHLDIVRLLVENGADINDQQNETRLSVLHAAAQTNNLAVAAYLLANGARLEVTDDGGFTPITRATLKSYPKMVKLLRNYGGKCKDKLGAEFFNYCRNAGS